MHAQNPARRVLQAVCVLTMLLSVPAGAITNVWVWWEGESPVLTDFPTSTWLDPGNQGERDSLADEDLLTHYNASGIVAFAEYDVVVPQTATYRLYTRKLWAYGPFMWNFDTQPAQNASADLQLLDSLDYKENFPLSWVYMGDVDLTAGTHAFRVVMNPASQPPEDASKCRIAGLDAFLLTTRPFVPRGKLKPGERFDLAEPGRWNFEPVPDPFGTNALLDLRYLNEDIAGQDGYVTLSGDKFYLGNGNPVRFWGVNVSNYGSDLASMEEQARSLAKRGVNIVRYFHSIESQASNPELYDVEEALIDGAHRTVAAFRKYGIYTKICPYFVLNFDIWPGWNIAGYPTGATSPFAVPMFDPDLKRAYKAWVTELFTRENPYTGVALTNDPAVAMIQIENEDNFFFYTFNPANWPEAQRAYLETEFGSYLIAKYGTINAAMDAWGTRTWNSPWTTDSPSTGRMCLLGAWYMTRAFRRNTAEILRMGDQIQFLTELQHAYFVEMRDFYRNTLHCRHLISATNWKTADESSLMDVERYTYTAGDMMDAHKYFAGIHVDAVPPDDHRTAVSVGDYYWSRTALTNPRRLPCLYKHTVNRASIMSESTWVNPTRYGAEGPLLVAAYSALTDIDGWFWFATGNLGYEESVPKFQVAVPTILGQFPGAALLYRRGDVAEAPTVVYDVRTPAEMYGKEQSLIWDDGGFEPEDHDPATRYTYDPITGTGRLDPLAMAVGKVESVYTNAPTADYVHADVLNLIDNDASTVSSITGELLLNWSNGVFTVDTPRSQAAVGFLRDAGSVDLTDVQVTCSNEYAAILVTSLDHRPLRNSNKILVQTMTEAWRYGWQEADKTFDSGNRTYDGKEIISLGQPPYNIIDLDTVITLKGITNVMDVCALDENGYRRSTVPSTTVGGSTTIALPPDTLYTIISRSGTDYDRWAERSFTDPLVDASWRAMHVDPDGDRLINAAEYVFHLNPTLPDKDLLPMWSSVHAGEFELHVDQTSLPDGFSFEAQASGDLVTWNPVSVFSSNGTDHTVRVPYSGQSPAYLRLQLRLPEQQTP